MSGKRGRSGPPGNLNRAKYPWRSFWRRRALRPTDAWVASIVAQHLAGSESDKPDMTEGEKRMAEVAATARGCWTLVLSYCQRVGYVRRAGSSWDLSPGAKELAKFLSVERQSLQALGLDRRQRPAMDLQTYLRERYAAKQAIAQGASQTAQDGSGSASAVEVEAEGDEDREDAE